MDEKVEAGVMAAMARAQEATRRQEDEQQSEAGMMERKKLLEEETKRARVAEMARAHEDKRRQEDEQRSEKRWMEVLEKETKRAKEQPGDVLQLISPQFGWETEVTPQHSFVYLRSKADKDMGARVLSATGSCHVDKDHNVTLDLHIPATKVPEIVRSSQKGRK